MLQTLLYLNDEILRSSRLCWAPIAIYMSSSSASGYSALAARLNTVYTYSDESFLAVNSCETFQ